MIDVGLKLDMKESQIEGHLIDSMADMTTRPPISATVDTRYRAEDSKVDCLLVKISLCHVFI